MLPQKKNLLQISFLCKTTAQRQWGNNMQKKSFNKTKCCLNKY